MKTLVYFDSGDYREKYQELPFAIVLVNPLFEQRIRQTGRVSCLGMNGLEAIDYLQSQNIQPDHVVTFNPVLTDRERTIGLTSNEFLGYLMKILPEHYTHHVNLIPGQKDARFNLNIPFNKRKLSRNSGNYIDPETFLPSSYKGIDKESVFSYDMKRKPVSAHQGRFKFGAPFTVVHESIWKAYEELDLLVIPSEEGRIYESLMDHFSSLPQVYIRKHGEPIEAVLRYCEENQLERVGFAPYTHGRVKDDVYFLEKYAPKFPQHYYFYDWRAENTGWSWLRHS